MTSSDQEIRSNHELRKKIYLIIFRADTPAGKTFDMFLLVLILLSIISVFLESIGSIRANYGRYIYIAEWVFTVLFTIEYILRVYSSHRPLRYIFSFYGFIDLIAFLPS
ncbi:TPA: ion transporter, partial [Escherichia coli]|nr:ion transporter [Escherichia coli]